MSEQHTSHTLSKHNPSCPRIALNISSFAEPWCMAQCGDLQVRLKSIFGDPGGAAVGWDEVSSAASASSSAKQRGWGFCTM